MNNAVNFILESGVSLALLSLIYILFLRKETFFRLNRLFLLFSILFSVILPFLKFRIYEPQSVILPEITVTQFRGLMEVVTIYGRDFSGTVEQVIISTQLLIAIYLLGLTFFIGRFIFRILQIGLLIRNNQVQKFKAFKLVFIKTEISPFSFLNYIFVSKKLQEDVGYDKMILHELEHIKQGHSFDILILEILTAFQWFNPFMWLLKRAIRENHEYLADAGVLTNGMSRGQYKNLLLYQFTGKQVALTNNFNYSLIKKRIKMMSKIKSSRLANVKFILGIAIAIVLVIVFACEQEESVVTEDVKSEEALKITFKEGKLKIEGDIDGLEKIRKMFAKGSEFEISGEDSLGFLLLDKVEIHEDELTEDKQVFFIVEEMPVFPGGELALRQFIGRSIKYPAVAQEKGIQGKVYVTFVVSRSGAIVNAKIARGVDPALDKEALRVVNGLPKWLPGKQRGKPVSVSYTVPINFVLQ